MSATRENVFEFISRQIPMKSNATAVHMSIENTVTPTFMRNSNTLRMSTRSSVSLNTQLTYSGSRHVTGNHIHHLVDLKNCLVLSNMAHSLR